MVKGDSAVEAGIKLIPLLLAVVVCSMISGGLITYIGYYNFVILPCMVLASVGAGMLTTLDVDSPMREWFGYQVLTGMSSFNPLPVHDETQTDTHQVLAPARASRSASSSCKPSSQWTTYPSRQPACSSSRP